MHYFTSESSKNKDLPGMGLSFYLHSLSLGVVCFKNRPASPVRYRIREENRNSVRKRFCPVYDTEYRCGRLVAVGMRRVHVRNPGCT